MSGIYKDVILCRASDDFVYETGQDGGLVSAILIWCLENGYIDGALVSGLESSEGGEGGWKATPMVATNRDEVLRGAGSRYTYSANTMAYDEAIERGLEEPGAGRHELPDVDRPGDVAPARWARCPARSSSTSACCAPRASTTRCSTSSSRVKYGLAKDQIKKMNIKGVFQIWMKDGNYHEINLKECHAWTREGCNHCPDFAAEHADISTGGIGDATDWTLTIVRTDLGREIIVRMLEAGVIEAKPGDSDPGAIKLMHKLSERSRARWPTWAAPEARVGLPEGAKADH